MAVRLDRQHFAVGGSGQTLACLQFSDSMQTQSVINIPPYTWPDAHLLNNWFTGQLITSVSLPVQDKGHTHHPERSFVFLVFSMISVAMVFFYC